MITWITAFCWHENWVWDSQVLLYYILYSAWWKSEIKNCIKNGHQFHCSLIHCCFQYWCHFLLSLFLFQLPPLSEVTDIALEVECASFGYLWGWSLCDCCQEVLAVDALTSWTTGLSTVSAPTLLCVAWISFAFAPFSQLAHFVSYGHDVLIGVPVKSVPMLIFYPPMVFWWQQIDVFGSCLCPHVDYPNCPQLRSRRAVCEGTKYFSSWVCSHTCSLILFSHFACLSSNDDDWHEWYKVTGDFVPL